MVYTEKLSDTLLRRMLINTLLSINVVYILCDGLSSRWPPTIPPLSWHVHAIPPSRAEACFSTLLKLGKHVTALTARVHQKQCCLDSQPRLYDTLQLLPGSLRRLALEEASFHESKNLTVLKPLGYEEIQVATWRERCPASPQLFHPPSMGMKNPS